MTDYYHHLEVMTFQLVASHLVILSLSKWVKAYYVFLISSILTEEIMSTIICALLSFIVF